MLRGGGGADGGDAERAQVLRVPAELGRRRLRDHLHHGVPHLHRHEQASFARHILLPGPFMVRALLPKVGGGVREGGVPVPSK